jgi:hypothetical protein
VSRRFMFFKLGVASGDIIQLIPFVFTFNSFNYIFLYNHEIFLSDVTIIPLVVETCQRILKDVQILFQWQVIKMCRSFQVLWCEFRCVGNKGHQISWQLWKHLASSLWMNVANFIFWLLHTCNCPNSLYWLHFVHLIYLLLIVPIYLLTVKTHLMIVLIFLLIVPIILMIVQIFLMIKWILLLIQMIWLTYHLSIFASQILHYYNCYFFGDWK